MQFVVTNVITIVTCNCGYNKKILTNMITIFFDHKVHSIFSAVSGTKADWPNPNWPDSDEPVGPSPIGQSRARPFVGFLPLPPSEGWRPLRVGAQTWKTEGWGTERWGPKISHNFVSFLPLLLVLSLNIGGVFEGRGAQMCTFGVLGLSCEAHRVPIGTLSWHKKKRN